MLKLKAIHPRFTIALTVGQWGGIYFHREYTWRVCLGWLALTVLPVDLDDLLARYIQDEHDLNVALAAAQARLAELDNHPTPVPAEYPVME